MNFYTFNSKKPYQTYLFIIMASYSLLDLGATFLLQYYIDKQTTNLFFREEVISKITHLQFQEEKIKDYIFIGSSRTQFHINTNLLKKNNFNTYNLGISGATIIDHGHTIHKVLNLESKPKNIIISISINTLFNNQYIDETIDDFNYALKTKNLHILYNAYIRFMQDSGLSLENKVFIKEGLSTIYSQYSITSFNEDNQTFSDKIYIDIDCTPFYKVSHQKEIILCTNGDGIIIKKLNIKPQLASPITLKNYNNNYIKYLRWLLEIIHQSNIQPIIILEPIFNKNYNYDLKKIKFDLNTNNIIDLTNFHLSHELWADSDHLNIDGRKIYTEKILQVLTNYEKLTNFKNF